VVETNIGQMKEYRARNMDLILFQSFLSNDQVLIQTVTTVLVVKNINRIVQVVKNIDLIVVTEKNVNQMKEY